LTRYTCYWIGRAYYNPRIWYNWYYSRKVNSGGPSWRILGSWEQL